MDAKPPNGMLSGLDLNQIDAVTPLCRGLD